MTSALSRKQDAYAGKENEVYTLQNVNTSQDIIAIASNPLHLITCLQNMRLINSQIDCNSCRIPMSLAMRKNSKCQYGFLCRQCHAVCSLSRGTFFEKNRMSYEGILLTLFSWACHVKPQSAAALFGINGSKVVKQYQCFRELCTEKLSKDPIKIGGIDSIVEVDENLYAIPSKDKSQNDAQKWLVGMYSQEDLTGVVVIVNDCSGETLFNVIKKHVLPGTTVWTNVINGLQKLSLHGYPHATFQQSAGAHMEYLPQFWCTVKAYLRNNCRIKSHQITEEYLNEYLWMVKYGKTHLDAYRHMLQHISECYPTNS